MVRKKVILNPVKNMPDYNEYKNRVHALQHSDQLQINKIKNSEQLEGSQKTKKQNERKKQFNAIHGHLYQAKMLMVFLCRSPYYSFRLGTEIAEANAFDDLVFEYSENNKNIYRLLQVKHKLKEQFIKITEHELLSTKGDYSLIKYFLSYQKLKNEKFFKNSTIKDIIIYTNINWDFENLKNAKIEIEKKEDEDNILDMDFLDIKKKPARYMFKSNVTSLLKTKMEERNINCEIDQIEDFLNHLVFAVDQPNEKELDNIIQKEIGKKFNISETENVYYRFFTKILSWMTDPEKDRFLSCEEGKKLFEERKTKIPVYYALQSKNLIFVFIERIDQLFNLDKMKLKDENENEMEQNVSCVNNLEGIDKNELIGKNIEEYSKEYDDKVIWINAETYEVPPMSSFRKLAEKYKSEYEFDYDIENFLSSLFLNYNELRILIMFCNTKWPKNIYALKLDTFNKKEAIEFITKLYNINDNTKKSNIKQLMKQLRYFLLTLQVIIFIKRQNKKLRNIAKKFSIHNYLNGEKVIKKKQRSLNFQNLMIIKIDYIKIIFKIWNIILDIIKQMLQI